MIHSGGTYGGHYSAYIKDFEDSNNFDHKEKSEEIVEENSSIINSNSWYHFNDTSVSPISVTDIAEVFG
jgi:hypothetical protein